MGALDENLLLSMGAVEAMAQSRAVGRLMAARAAISAPVILPAPFHRALEPASVMVLFNQLGKRLSFLASAKNTKLA